MKKRRWLALFLSLCMIFSGALSVSATELTDVNPDTEVVQETDITEGEKQDEQQKIEDVTFYPQTFFSPYDYINCRKFITEDTYCMHHFYKSWLPLSARLKSKVKENIAQVIGGDNIAKIRKLIGN